MKFRILSGLLTVFAAILWSASLANGQAVPVYDISNEDEFDRNVAKSRADSRDAVDSDSRHRNYFYGTSSGSSDLYNVVFGLNAKSSGCGCGGDFGVKDVCGSDNGKDDCGCDNAKDSCSHDNGKNSCGCDIGKNGCGCGKGFNGCGCGSGNNGCGCGFANNGCGCSCYRWGPDEPLELFSRGCNGVKVGGHLQLGFHTQGANGIGTGLFNNRPDEVQLQQAWVYIDREAQTGCGFDWGFRLDYVYGTDGQDTQAFGSVQGDWDTGWDNGSTVNGYGSAMPQLYAEIAYNDLRVKGGHFYTIIGYEVVPAPDNFFYSKAFTMVLAEPFTHTGVLAEFEYSDLVTLYGGWTQGWDTGFTPNGGDTFLGGISAQWSDNVSITWAVSIGDFGFGPGGSDRNGYMHSFVTQWEINERLTYVNHIDYVDNAAFVGGTVAAINTRYGTAIVQDRQQTYSHNNYLLYTIDDCWAVGARIEWFKFGGHEAWETTFGVNYKPHANMVIRPEIRFDDYQSALNVMGIKDSTVFGVDAVVTW